ncbi:MAG: L,D-transpeptidase family protein [Planctomycetes bacterium]|nr:L,D-transpeptidase family protein [Planctomycetota bacterium]
MPISYKSPYRRHVLTLMAVVFAALSAVGARQQGWLGAADTRRGVDRSGAEGESFDVPPPDDELQHIPVELSEVVPAKAESLDVQEFDPPTADESPRVRPSDWIASGVEQAGYEEDAAPARRSGKTRSAVVTAGFEEEAPPAPTGEDDRPLKKKRAGTGDEKTPVARRSAESATGATRRDDAAGGRKPGLMSGEKIQELIDDGRYVEAQQELSQWYWQKPEARERILPKLNKLSQALYFAPQPFYYEPYVVKPGDQLRVIGQKYKIPWEYVAKLNHVDAKKIRAGQKLKVVPGPFAVLVNLERFELVVHLDGSYVKRYRVGVGKDGSTPVGTFVVKNKMVDPTYYGPDGVIAHDDPENPLGERWIDIGDSFGIHGTNEPDSIGKNESKGCVRMLNSEVEEVYDFLIVGSEVKIIRK